MLTPTPYIICEINTAHFGDLEEAIKAADLAKAAGADAIKFQSWTPESLYSRAYLRANSVASRFLEKFSLQVSDLQEISRHCGAIDLGFASTVYSRKEISELLSVDRLDFIKIASMDLVNEELIDEALSTGVQLVLSTGMASKEEVFQALDPLRNKGSKVSVLHCTSLYPTSLEDSNVGNISWLERDFPEFQVGFSDHTLQSFAAVAAVTLGAQVVEKHMTFDKSKPGMDNAMAQSAEEFLNFASVVRATYASKLSTERSLTLGELEQSKQMRRSAHATVDIAPGEHLTWEMISFVRPGTGIQSNQIAAHIGARVSTAILAGELIEASCLGDFSSK